MIDVVAAELSARYTPRRHREHMLSFGSPAEWEEYLERYLARDDLPELLRESLKGTERVVFAINQDIRKRIKNATDEYDVFDFALAVHCLQGKQYVAFMAEQTKENGKEEEEGKGKENPIRYSLMEARRNLAVLRKACKEAPEEYPGLSRYTAVRWLCYRFATGVEKNIDLAGHQIRVLNGALESLPAATRNAALRVMNGRQREDADVARFAPMLVECGIFYRLIDALPQKLRGVARMLMAGSRHSVIAKTLGMSEEEVTAYRNELRRLAASLRPGTGPRERHDG